MRVPVLLVLWGVTLGAAACATVEPTPAPPEPTPAASAAPLPTEGHDWLFSADDDIARLAYGVPESDGLKLGFDCRRASGQLEIVAIAAKGAKAEISVESGGETERFPARSEPSQLDDGVLLTADASTADPVFQRFRRVGWMALWRDGEREAYAPQPGSARNVEGFFAFCG
jgi:hypothetical protein